MRRILRLSLLGLIILCLLPVIAVSSGCSSHSEAKEGFSIYLTRDDVLPDFLKASSHIDLAELPLITTDDIVSYNGQTHELKLTQTAYSTIVDLDVPLRGKSFVACVDKKPVYTGAFWTPISSFSFDGITIWKPLGKKEPYVVTLELGYPSSSFYGAEDPRNDPEIIGALKQAGKYVEKLSISDVGELPHSMKGYELYSWFSNGEWNYTLITGTNRNKTLGEIIATQDIISENGWVRVHVIGESSILTVLGKIPRKEYVSWLGQMRLGPTPDSGVEVALPPESIINAIKQYARDHGLEFMVQLA